MKFEYQGKLYDIRFKSRYLPQGLKEVGTVDKMILMSSRTSKVLKQDLLSSYLKEAKVL